MRASFYAYTQPLRAYTRVYLSRLTRVRARVDARERSATERAEGSRSVAESRACLNGQPDGRSGRFARFDWLKLVTYRVRASTLLVRWLATKCLPADWLVGLEAVPRGVDILGRGTYIKFNRGGPPPPSPRRWSPNTSSRFARDASRVSSSQRLAVAWQPLNNCRARKAMALLVPSSEKDCNPLALRKLEW